MSPSMLLLTCHVLDDLSYPHHLLSMPKSVASKESFLKNIPMAQDMSFMATNSGQLSFRKF